MPTFNEPARPLEFLVSEANGSISREQVTIAVAAPAMVAGTVLGRITASGQWTVYNDGAASVQGLVGVHRALVAEGLRGERVNLALLEARLRARGAARERAQHLRIVRGLLFDGQRRRGQADRLEEAQGAEASGDVRRLLERAHEVLAREVVAEDVHDRGSFGGCSRCVVRRRAGGSRAPAGRPCRW